jgi:hypothetical protein
MNRQEASLFFRPRVVSCSPVPPNKAMQTGGRFAAAADRQAVRPRDDINRCKVSPKHWPFKRGSRNADGTSSFRG